MQRKPERQRALTVMCQVSVAEGQKKTEQEEEEEEAAAAAGELFTLSVSFTKLVNVKARNSISRAVGRRKKEYRCSWTGSTLCWKKPWNMVQEDYGCSSFFFSDIRFFLAASIS